MDVLDKELMSVQEAIDKILDRQDRFTEAVRTLDTVAMADIFLEAQTELIRVLPDMITDETMKIRLMDVVTTMIVQVKMETEGMKRERGYE